MKLFNKRGHLVSLLVVTAVLLIGVSGWAWWHYQYSQPTNVFWGMVDDSLQTRSVTHVVSQQSDAQSSLQVSRLQTAPQNIVVGFNRISQTVGSSTSKVATESVGTPFVDFVRYAAISTSSTDKNTKTPNYKDVEGVWGKSAQADPKSADGQLYSQAALGVVPFANLPADQRKAVVSQMKKDGAYSFDASKVKQEIKGHRPIYVYDVTIKPVAYVAALKSLGSKMGLTQLDSVNPNDYASSPEVTFTMTVDVWGRQLMAAAQPAEGSIDLFGSYGLTSIDTKLPNATTTIDDLQSKIQQSSQQGQ